LAAIWVRLGRSLVPFPRPWEAVGLRRLVVVRRHVRARISWCLWWRRRERGIHLGERRRLVCEASVAGRMLRWAGT
jgi:hypothetical protein